MQNNKFIKFIKARGYYIVLLICAVAVGVTGYFLLTTEKEKAPTVQVVAGESEHQAEVAATEPAESVVATQEQEVAATQTPEAFSLTLPVNGEAVTAFAADYLAYNATTKDWRTHEGVDLSAVLGQEVLAAADGTVHSIYEDENYGMTVVVQHADGYSTHYSNLSEEVAVTVGQQVSAGTVLGTVGTSANVETATAPHLHFSLYKDGSPVDPSEFLTLISD